MSRILNAESVRQVESAVNPHICGGVGDAIDPDHVEEVIRARCAAVFDGSFHVTLASLTRCTPEETFRIISTQAYGKYFDIAESTIYLYKLDLCFKGTPLKTRFISMVYSDNGPTIKLSDSSYALVPVISDARISPGRGGVFLRLLRDKLNISSPETIGFFKNGIAMTTSIPSVKIYRQTPSNAVTTAPTSILSYLLALYGFEGAIKMLTGETIMPKIVSIQDSKKYRNSEHICYETIGVKPRSGFVGKSYTPSKAMIVYPKGKISKVMEDVIGSLMYMMTYRPDVTVEEWNTDKSYWYILAMHLFGRLIPARLDDSISNHLRTLDSYVDKYLVTELQIEFPGTFGEDLTKDGFYRILKVCFVNFDTWTLSSGPISRSLYNKKIQLLYHILYDTFMMLNSIAFELQQRRDQLTLSLTSDRVIRGIFKLTIFKINDGNPAVQQLNYSGDSLFRGYSSRGHLQLNAAGSAVGGARKSTPDATTTLNNTTPVIGSIHAITRNKMAPTTVLNPYAPYDPETNDFQPSERIIRKTIKLKEVLNRSARMPDRIDIPEVFTNNILRIEKASYQRYLNKLTKEK